MLLELIYTSAAKGLEPGKFGFCTVAMTDQLPPPIQIRLENLSGYRVLKTGPTGGRGNSPIRWAHYRMEISYQTYSVLSMVKPSGMDYSGRGNILAHHLMLDASDIRSFQCGPARILMDPRAMKYDRWDTEPQLLRFRHLDCPAEHPSDCRHWKRLGWDPGWAGILVDKLLIDASRPAYILYEPGTNLLPLIADAIALMPGHQRWRATFSTYYTTEDLASQLDCCWRCCVAGTEAAQGASRRASMVLDLTRGPQPLPDDAVTAHYVRLARGESVTAVAASSRVESAVGPSGGTEIGLVIDAPNAGAPPLDGGSDTYALNLAYEAAHDSRGPRNLRHIRATAPRPSIGIWLLAALIGLVSGVLIAVMVVTQGTKPPVGGTSATQPSPVPVAPGAHPREAAPPPSTPLAPTPVTAPVKTLDTGLGQHVAPPEPVAPTPAAASTLTVLPVDETPPPPAPVARPIEIEGAKQPRQRALQTGDAPHYYFDDWPPSLEYKSGIRFEPVTGKAALLTARNVARMVLRLPVDQTAMEEKDFPYRLEPDKLAASFQIGDSNRRTDIGTLRWHEEQLQWTWKPFASHLQFAPSAPGNQVQKVLPYVAVHGRLATIQLFDAREATTIIQFFEPATLDRRVGFRDPQAKTRSPVPVRLDQWAQLEAVTVGADGRGSGPVTRTVATNGDRGLQYRFHRRLTDKGPEYALVLTATELTPGMGWRSSWPATELAVSAEWSASSWTPTSLATELRDANSERDKLDKEIKELGNEVARFQEESQKLSKRVLIEANKVMRALRAEAITGPDDLNELTKLVKSKLEDAVKASSVPNRNRPADLLKAVEAACADLDSLLPRIAEARKVQQDRQKQRDKNKQHLAVLNERHEAIEFLVSREQGIVDRCDIQVRHSGAILLSDVSVSALLADLKPLGGN